MEFHKEEDAYVNTTQSYFNNMGPMEENRRKKIISRPFSTNEQLLDGKKIIKDCAKNKLGIINKGVLIFSKKQ